MRLGFVSWRSRQQKSAKTLSDYLAAGSGLLNWMKSTGLLKVNPLEGVKRVDGRGKETFKRRAFTEDEMGRLLAVVGPRRPVYLAAVHTGLRRGELTQLRWGDVHLDGDPPYQIVRAATAKNRKETVPPLVAELVQELWGLRPAGVDGGVRAFNRLVPNRDTVKRDLERAGIVRADSQVRRVVFHSLRHTFITNLRKSGLSLRVAMEAARHSDQRLTDHVYTNVSGLPVGDIVKILPRYLKRDSRIDSQGASQQSTTGSPDLSQVDAVFDDDDNANSFAANEKRHAEACLVAGGHTCLLIGGGGNRTPVP
jgi:integrase